MCVYRSVNDLSEEIGLFLEMRAGTVITEGCDPDEIM